MITKAMFKTLTAMHQAEEKLCARVVTLNLRYTHSGEFNGQIFATAWNDLLEFWKTKKRFAFQNSLPKAEIKS